MGKEYIVAISEGEKTERQIIENLQVNFFKNKVSNNKELIILSFKTNIYALWNVMKRDDFETDIIEVLAERDKSIESFLKTIDKKLISEIYLFFDYDGHACNKESEIDNIVSQMIERFDNETENGKMYISYPMVEAIKDLKRKDNCSRRCRVSARDNIHYKMLVAQDTEFENLTKLTIDDWYLILASNLKKANCIVSSLFVFPSYKGYKEIISQAKIFQSQVNKFIDVDKTVAVLSGVPFFLIDYFGEGLFEKIKQNNSDENENVIKKCPIHSGKNSEQ